MPTSVLFLLPYPLHKAPSQRFRVEAFFPLLRHKNIHYRTDVFLDEAAWKALYQKGSVVRKVWAVCKGYLKRLFTILFFVWRYEYIFVHREAAPLGPPLFEWLLAKVFRKKIIYDFDDAIWIPAVTESNRLAASVKCFWKVRFICKWAYKISVGNHYLAGFARQYNRNVHIVPTCVDTDNRFNKLKNQATDELVIGWTGSHSTLPYLNLIYPVLQRLENKYNFRFLVICNQPPRFSLKNLQFLPWKEATEIEDLLQINIGLMPLLPDAWSEGKCGFKIIQYLSVGIPAVASPVGVNKQIIEEGVNGYLCHTEEEWYAALERLILNSQLRAAMGKRGREKIKKQYSIQANEETFLALFR